MSRLNGKRQEAEQKGIRVKVAILGAGRIAHSLAKTLVMMTMDERYSHLIAPYAVAARSGERARAFAAQYGFERSYGSYQELLEDSDVDLVYIATPHNLHAEQAIACMKAGKNVLVEKSFTANASQARQVLKTSRETGLLCTEAIWTRYMPSRSIIDQVVASGDLGTVQTVTGNLGYVTTGKARMTDPALAGGALLDVGVYPLNFIDMVMGPKPIERISTDWVRSPEGVDSQNSMTLFYRDGSMGAATSSMVSDSDRFGSVWGSRGYLMCGNINNVESLDLYNSDHRLTRSYPIPAQLTGYEYEVASSAEAILDGKTECPEMPHQDTLRIMELMDSIRHQWGLVYPFEA
ncbi:Gfo/Idh/MocA family oxidoreductase [uncultured Bifidobacterium sp.]|uniref:Gfo/Idh/MocA family protein n=1 Tax=uncultured Bifidobacterium sp. TaxID=165187 RepID=UPI002624CFE1|nr:Gfo/Idh/MocA family oxidoreductase [uncultured Bifidobacterium sp.]